jgi:hypothetical protein
MALYRDNGLHKWSQMTLKNTKGQVDLVALVYLIDPGVLVSLVAVLALMAFQGVDDLQDRQINFLRFNL